ncbi:uncharacterized protein LOC100905682 [Galendromus occidentalis]|uniref:Uncharacterized protein LOC100905682 n=1 Tax=Galendromus occidentalis TaxID=34638 RepID=A0AAJ6QUS6_9ACAR|nr:uncharacterized protein LOC100905682 [Galendromus occidentalis]
MFFLKARPESDWHGVRGVSEITVRPEIFYEADRDFQDIHHDLGLAEVKPPKRRINFFMRRRKSAKGSESPNKDIIAAKHAPDVKTETSNKKKAKKKFSFMRSKTICDTEDAVKNDNKTSPGLMQPRDDPNEFKYSDISTFVKIQEVDVPKTSFLKVGDLKSLMNAAGAVPDDSPCHISPLRDYEGTSISDSFSWKTDTWKDPWCDLPQSPSMNSSADDRSDSRTSSTLEKRRKPFFPFRTSEPAKNSEKRGSLRRYGKKGIDLETAKQLNQMISLVASEECEDPWEDSWNRWQSSDTFTAESTSESERMTPEIKGWADFSILRDPQQIASTAAGDTLRCPSERLMNTSRDSTESIASHDNVPSLYEKDPSLRSHSASDTNQKRQRPRSWFRSTSKHNDHSNVFQEAQTLLDILHETFPEQELGSPDTDLRTV